MSFYNPAIHNRRSIRLKGYDYSQSGLYFITVCCHERNQRFGEIVNGEMVLNEMGIIAYQQWIQLSERFVNFELDVFQIMPDHIHVIISLNVGATLAVDPNNETPLAVGPNNKTILAVGPNNEKILAVGPGNNLVDPDSLGQQQGLSLQPTIGAIIGAYKSIVSNECLKTYKSKNQYMGKLWQRNYYEHIIRSYESYVDISNYIIDNPKKWNRK